LQRHLENLPVVGKTFSVADYVKRINRVLHQNDPSYDAIPDSKETIGQYLFLFSMSAKPSDLDNVVDYPFRRANIWVQLKTWDADAMRKVIQATEEYKSRHPTSLAFRPAGIAYFNLIWNNEVLWDMVKGFILALIVVFVILALNFRSIKWAIVGYIPLVFTVILIYGFIGFTGKNFDMPISVLSCLSLGMAVDFAIHFVSRLRSRLSEVQVGDPVLTGAWVQTEAQGHAGVRAQSHGQKRFVRDKSKLVEGLLWTAARPGKGILRNAILFASAFSVMLLAPLTPYITVGAFIVSMMTLSALMTIICLPALIILLRRWLFGGVN
jgi:predicted RND superfamily exporter protein